MTSLERTLAFIKGEHVDRIPFHPIIMRWAAKYAGINYRDFCLDPVSKCKAMILCAKDFEIDWVTVMSDPWVEASAFGIYIEYPENNLPIDISGHFPDAKSAAKLRRYNPLKNIRCQNRLSEIHEFKRQLSNELFIVGWVEGPVAEYVDLTIAISGYSARMIRELYTHHIGVSRLQESTRYVDCKNFEFYIPDSIKNNKEALQIYKDCMASIRTCYSALLYNEIPKQDIANILPLGMNTSVVIKINLRALLHMSELRLCNRSLKEYQDFMIELRYALLHEGEEWQYIMDNYYRPKCEKYKICEEKYGCGMYSKYEK